MAFDAGAIMAHVDISTSQADRDLDRIENRIRSLERRRHRIPVDAVFNDSSVGRARMLFAQLDNMLSRDAANRMRSSPQGSVLGTLNSLFSPHPVAGAPTVAQAAAGGMLGRMAAGQGAGGLPASGPVPRGLPQQEAVDRQQNETLTRLASQQQQNSRADAQQTNMITRLFGMHSATQRVVMSTTGGTAARRERVVMTEVGGGGGGDGGRRGHWYGGFSIPGGPYVGRSFGRGLAGGIGPGIPGISARLASMVGLGGAALGALPALAAPLAALGVGGAGLGVLGLGAHALIGSKQDPGQLYKQAQEAMKSVQKAIEQGAQPMLGPLRRAFSEVPRIVHGLAPVLHQVFAGAATLIQPLLHGLADLVRMIGPGLGRAFRAVAPLIRPMIDGLGQLVRGILPGLVALLRAAHPAITAFASILGQLGRGVGQMLRSFAPAIRESTPIFRALGAVIAALFPIVGRVAAIFARTLGPVFTQLAAVIRSLIPILAPLGRLLARLAAAVLADFASALKAVLILIRDMEPSIRILAGALGQVFSILESSGVFAALGTALEQVAPLLARLVNTLVRGFAPVLPTLIRLLSQVSQIMVTLFAAGLAVVLRSVTALLNHFPVLSKLILVAAAAWGILTLAMSVNPVVAITVAIIALIGAVYELVKHWHRVWADIKNWAADAWHFLTHGWGQLLIPGLTAIVKTVQFVSHHWRQAWQDMRNWAVDAWHAVYNEVLSPIDRFFTRIIPGWWDRFIGYTSNRLWDPLQNGFRAAWNWIISHVLDPIGRFFGHTIPGWWDSFISATHSHLVRPWQSAIAGAWHWITSNVWDPVHRFLFTTIPGWFDTAVSKIGRAWWAIRSAIRGPVSWVVDNVLNGLIDAFDWITSHLGLGKPIHETHPMGLAKGGHLPGYGGGDRHLALLESGETVVPKEEANRPDFVTWAKSRGIRGYQSGGRVGQGPPSGRTSQPPATTGRFGPLPRGGPDIGHAIGTVLHKALDIGKITAALATGNVTALSNAVMDLLGHTGVGGATADMARMLEGMVKELLHDIARWLMANGGGASGNAIVQYAERFIGRIPYVWGGTAVPGGADCSGFVQAIYRHFNIAAPRTSEQQGAWVKRTPPTPGGLAFYHSPPGGPDPGHVAIVRDGKSVISQGGGMGPQVEPLHMLPLLWTGIPPHGFGTAAGKVLSGPAQSIARALLARHGWGNQWGAFNSIEMREAGWNLHARNPSSGAYGMAQFIQGPSEYYKYGGNPNTAYGQLTAMMNYIAQRYGSPNAAWRHEQRYGWYDQGGWLGPGPNLAFNATSQREAVLTPSQSRAFIDLGEAARLFSRGQGQPGSGHLMRDLYLMMPEGSTVAQAMNEVTFRLQAHQLAGYAGVP